MQVKVPRVWIGRERHDVVVSLEPVGRDWDNTTIWNVAWDGRDIGHVQRGYRTYSPPLSPGSRIVKYHKQVPEWWGHDTEDTYASRIHGDTRRDVIRRLIEKAADGD